MIVGWEITFSGQAFLLRGAKVILNAQSFFRFSIMGNNRVGW
jgi:hypothetical protein